MQHSWLTFAALAVALIHVLLHNAVAEAARVRSGTRHFMFQVMQQINIACCTGYNFIRQLLLGLAKSKPDRAMT